MVADIAKRLQGYFCHYEQLGQVGVLEQSKVKRVASHLPARPSTNSDVFAGFYEERNAVQHRVSLRVRSCCYQFTL